jgi:hypothetical protein
MTKMDLVDELDWCFREWDSIHKEDLIFLLKDARDEIIALREELESWKGNVHG